MRARVRRGASGAPPDAHAGLQQSSERAGRNGGWRARRSAAASGSGGLGARAVGAEPLGAVGAHRLDDRDERAALLGQRVLDARRDLGERLARRRCPPPRAPAGAARACAGRCPPASARARRSATGPRRGRGSRAASTCRRRCRRYGRQGSRSSARTPSLSKTSRTEVGYASATTDVALLGRRARRVSVERVAARPRARRRGRPSPRSARPPARDQQVAALEPGARRRAVRRRRRARAARRAPGGRPRRACARAARGGASATPSRGRPAGLAAGQRVDAARAARRRRAARGSGRPRGARR